MLGEVKGASNETVKKILDNLSQTFSVLREQKKIIIPPIPRYMFGGCCADPMHAPNTSDTEDPKRTLSDHLRIRNTIKQSLVSKGEKRLRVLDFVGIYAPDHLNMHNKTLALKTITHTDNVHLTQQGYDTLADTLIKQAQSLTKASLAVDAPLMAAPQQATTLRTGEDS